MNKSRQRNDRRKKILENLPQEKFAVPQDTVQAKVGDNT